MKFQKLLIISVGLIALLAGAGYSYVFIAGAPQPDAPPTTTKDSKLTFALKPSTARRWMKPENTV